MAQSGRGLCTPTLTCLWQYMGRREGYLIGHVTNLAAPLCSYNVSISRCSRRETAPTVTRLLYTDHAGPEISLHLSIAWPFSRQIAIGNGGPTSALKSMGAKQYFRCHFLNIGPSYKH